MTFRALLFCHDGTSLGHLQFLSRIADGLHPEIACLIVTGMREIDRLIPRTSEYRKLPNWDYLLRSRAELRGSAFSFDLGENQEDVKVASFCGLRAPVSRPTSYLSIISLLDRGTSWLVCFSRQAP